jgi:tetratricopeptide (TPR) repeat protein
MVGDAVLSAIASGDIGEQVRALEMLGNGFNEVRRYGEALAFFDRAIKISSQNPDCGFPYMAYEGKGWTLAGEGQFHEAQRALDYALTTARQNEKYGHQSQILIEKGELALRLGNRQQAIEYLEQGGNLGRQHAFFRVETPAKRWLRPSERRGQDGGLWGNLWTLNGRHHSWRVAKSTGLRHANVTTTINIYVKTVSMDAANAMKSLETMCATTVQPERLRSTRIM